ncbi:MAG TPA: GDSL-type esterase/lipase family protein [Candidatus Sulfotelmatobacter sp.]|nr:GDSL-type esterase/lipase family protein [Candidatus Sulfotelmatobacter sp.]
MRTVNRFCILVLVTLLAACGGGDETESTKTSSKSELATYLSPQNDMLELNPFSQYNPPIPDFQNKTIRQVAHISVGGDGIKIRLSNEYGTTPLTLDKVRVSKSLGKGTVDLSSDTAVLFSGREQVTIPPGAEIASDEVPIRLASLNDLAVSIYVKQASARTQHRGSNTTTYFGDGDLTSSANIPNAQTITSGFFVSQISVIRQNKANVVVAFGDSITEGAVTPKDANLSWPNQLSAIVNARTETSVVNAGIGGNAWVKNTSGPCGLCRFQRDVLNVPGVTHVVLALGINDIGLGYFYANTYNDASWVVTSKQITDSIQAAIDAAKAKGLKVYGTTLLPFKGAFYYTSGQPTEIPAGMSAPYDGEQVRQSVNAFVRTNPSLDGVIDLDRIMQDPSNPLSQRIEWNAGDYLHPNATGNVQIAEAVNLVVFK